MLTIEARAKINLTLDITGLRPDGFHAITTIMQTIGLSDTVELTKATGAIALDIADNPDVPTGEQNLAWQAAQLLRENYLSPTDGVSIKLTKRIPMGAGLAGGSTDAAAVLAGMDRLYGLRLSPEELCRVGAELGSDIPFCLRGGTMLATGRGEILTELPPLPHTYVVLAKPNFAVSTPWAYREYDRLGTKFRPDTSAMRQSLAVGDRNGAAKLLGNALEIPVAAKYPEIKRLKQIMLAAGALGALMSGSGSTVFALTENKMRAEAVASALSAENVTVFVTETYNKEFEV